MKKLILLLYLSLLYVGLNAQQQYKSVLDGEIVRWSIIGDVLDFGMQSVDLRAYSDTIINDVSYKRIYIGRYFEFEETNIKWKDWIDGNYWKSEYFIRESEDASKLYLYDEYSEKEILMSDMNLEIGDEFPVPEIWKRSCGIFDWIDTLIVEAVYMKDGLKHIQFDHEWKAWFYGDGGGYNYHTAFIEGIGPNTGLFHDFWWSLGQIVNCFQNQSFYYKNEYVSLPCGYWENFEGIDNIFSDKDYSVQLNENNIEIYSSVNEPIRVAFYDLLGKVHYNQVFSTNQNVLIPRSFFSQGIYLLKIISENKNQVQTIKIIL